MWREQRSTNAMQLDPNNQNKTKRRGAGVVHTNCDNLMTKWSGLQRWWETSKGWDSFRRTAEEICKEIKPSNWKNENNQEEDERTKSIVKERDKLRRWDPSWCHQTRVQNVGDSNLVVNWLNGRSKINNKNSKLRCKRHRICWTRETSRMMSDHMDLFQHIYRDWNEEADHLTHEAREKGPSWNSFSLNEEEQLDVRRQP